MKQWVTIPNFYREDKSVTPDKTYYAKDILQPPCIIVYHLSKSAIFYVGPIKKMFLW